jgi:Zn-dependent protease
LPSSLDLTGAVLNVIVLLLSLTVHEFFHAWSAYRLGDDTAARAGRLTLNPIPHIDLIGTILLPLLQAPIGWAKPVPVNPSRFRKSVTMATGDIIVSAAGPLSNVGLGLVAAIVWGLLARLVPTAVAEGTAGYAFLDRLLVVNAGLAVFNLLPIPPLDGGHVAASLMPYRWRPAWDRFAQLAPFLLMILVYLNFRTGILSAVLGPPRHLILAVYDLVASLIAG